jgi:hypothetical protein
VENVVEIALNLDASTQIAQREVVDARIHQEVSQNVEQVRLDIVRGTQGRAALDAAGADLSRAVADPNYNSSPVGVGASHGGKIGTNLPEVRERILDRIERTREQLYLVSGADTSRQEAQTAIQGRGDFRGTTELRHDAKPESVVARADRSENSFDVIGDLIKRCSDIKLAIRIQEGVDKLCYTLFGVTALGALAGDRATRFTYRTLRQILAELRSRAVEDDLEPADRALIEGAVQQLGDELVVLAREVGRVSASAVADLSGIITIDDTSEPLSGVTVHGGALGVVTTDERGIFTFANVPLQTQYQLTPLHSKYRFVPGRVVGSCFELNFERFFARSR